MVHSLHTEPQWRLSMPYIEMIEPLNNLGNLMCCLVLWDKHNGAYIKDTLGPASFVLNREVLF